MHLIFSKTHLAINIKFSAWEVSNIASKNIDNSSFAKILYKSDQL